MSTSPFDLPTPSAIDSERALLGCIFQEPEVLAQTMGRLEAEDFWRPEHGALYGLLCTMYTDGAAIQNPDTLMLRVLRNGGWDTVGGAAYIASLPDHAPSWLAWKSYLDNIVESAEYRRVIDAGLALARGGYERQRSPSELMDELIGKLTEIGSRRRSETVMHIGEAIDYAKRRRGEGRGNAISTNIPELDKRLAGGMYPGNLIIVGARPSWGKTGFSVGVVLEHALRGGQAGICSLEEEVDDITWRVISQVSGVPGDVVQNEDLQSLEERQRIADAEVTLREIGLRIDATSGSTIADIYRTCQRWKASGGLDVVAIDYLGLIKHAKAESQRVAIGNTVRNCKHIAKKLGIPVILCVQLNRDALEVKPGITSKANAKAAGIQTEWWHKVPQPQLHHMKETGDIEQDADKVIFPIPAAVLVDQGYAPRDLGTRDDDAVIFVAKCRRGKIGPVPAKWCGPTASYHAADTILSGGRAFRVVGGRDHHEPYAADDDYEPL